MKNRISINEITDITLERFGRDFRNLERMLIDNGIDEEEIENFFVHVEGEPIRIRINDLELRKRLRDEDFLVNFASDLFSVVDNRHNYRLVCSLEYDDFFLDDKEQFYKDKVLFEVKYNQIDHVVTVNDLVVSKPESFSSNDCIMEYLVRHPNKDIGVKNSGKHSVLATGNEGDIEMKKTASKVINQLGFKGLARKIFFPKATIKIIHFTNPVTTSELKRRGYDTNLKMEDLFPDKF